MNLLHWIAAELRAAVHNEWQASIWYGMRLTPTSWHKSKSKKILFIVGWHRWRVEVDRSSKSWMDFWSYYCLCVKLNCIWCILSMYWYILGKTIQALILTNEYIYKLIYEDVMTWLCCHNIWDNGYLRWLGKMFNICYFVLYHWRVEKCETNFTSRNHDINYTNRRLTHTEFTRTQVRVITGFLDF